MSFVTTQPEAVLATAQYLRTAGSSLTSYNDALAGSITAVAPAASDEVSMLTAAQFSAQGQVYQSLAAQAAAIHDQFVAALNEGGSAYATTEAINAAAAAISS